MDLFDELQSELNKPIAEISLGSPIFKTHMLHRFYEGFCLLVYENVIYLVGDGMKVLYQQESETKFIDFNSKLEFFDEFYIYAATVEALKVKTPSDSSDTSSSCSYLLQLINHLTLVTSSKSVGYSQLRFGREK